MANVGLLAEEHPEANKESLVLMSLRAVLISAGRAVGGTKDFDELERASLSAGMATHSGAFTALYVRSAARAITTANFAASTVTQRFSLSGAIIDSALSTDMAAGIHHRSSESYGGLNDPAVFPAATYDASQKFEELMHLPVWVGAEVPEAIAENYTTFLTYLDSHADWAFWRRWYGEMWEGTFTDWDLAIAVAKIPDDVWEQGLGAVAEAIREIEADRDSDNREISPELVPVSNIIPLFERSPIVQASMASMSEAISLRLDAFSSMARPNERVAFVETLRNMPETAQRISDILEKGPNAANADTALALEVGRLRAEVEQLKRDLKAAHVDLEELRKTPWYKKASVLIAGSVFPAIGVALWTILDEDFDGAGRWKNVAEELQFLQSKVWPSPDDRLLEELRFELPNVEDI